LDDIVKIVDITDLMEREVEEYISDEEQKIKRKKKVIKDDEDD